jgi:hypothetical protein
LVFQNVQKATISLAQTIKNLVSLPHCLPLRLYFLVLGFAVDDPAG